jgi:hypothetical protein
MNRLLTTIRSSRRWKLALLVVGLALLALAGGIAYAASSDAASVINACAKTDNGQLRLDTGSGCLPSEQAVQFALPQDTVRHVTGFIHNRTTASTPVRSAAGLLGTLSFTCSDLTYRTDSSDTGTFSDRVLFYSPQVPTSPFWELLDSSDHVTVTWSDAPQVRWFQMQIEGTVGNQPLPTLTQINGFVKGFPEFEGCAYFAYVGRRRVAANVHPLAKTGSGELAAAPPYSSGRRAQPTCHSSEHRAPRTLGAIVLVHGVVVGSFVPRWRPTALFPNRCSPAPDGCRRAAITPTR